MAPTLSVPGQQLSDSILEWAFLLEVESPRFPAMAGPFELKRLWRKYREYRVNRKGRLSEGSLDGMRRDDLENPVLEEAGVIVVGLGMGTKHDVEHVEYGLDDDEDDDDDPRFINNPHGIGCSRTYEVPYDDFINSLSTSPASMSSRPPQEIDLDEIDGLRSLARLGPWKSEHIDMVKGKRKGREPGDSANDRYKFLLDRHSPRIRSPRTSFTLPRRTR